MKYVSQYFPWQKRKEEILMKLQNKRVAALKPCLSHLCQNIFFLVYSFSLYGETTNTWFLGFSHTLPKELKVLQSKVEVYTKI